MCLTARGWLVLYIFRRISAIHVQQWEVDPNPKCLRSIFFPNYCFFIMDLDIFKHHYLNPLGGDLLSGQPCVGSVPEPVKRHKADAVLFASFHNMGSVLVWVTNGFSSEVQSRDISGLGFPNGIREQRFSCATPAQIQSKTVSSLRYIMLKETGNPIWFNHRDTHEP